MPRNLDWRCSLNGIYGNNRVLSCCTRSVWIIHGAVGALASVVTLPLAGRKVKHAWIEIKTNYGWAVAQINKPDSLLTLRWFATRKAAISDGLRSAGRINDNPDPIIYTSDLFDKFNIERELCLKDIHDWMSCYDCEYDLLTNNCQILCEKFTLFFSYNHAMADYLRKDYDRRVGNETRNYMEDQEMDELLGHKKKKNLLTISCNIL